MSGISPREPSASPAVAGSVLSGTGNIASTLLNYRLQKQLQVDSYNNYLAAARAAGASPASIAQGLTGAGTASMPTVSVGANPFPDLGQSIIGGRNVEIGQQNADTEQQYKGMLTKYQPELFRNQAFAASAKAFRDLYGVELDKSQKQNLDEQTKQLVLLRPWTLKQAEQTFNNLVAEYDRIHAQTGLYREQTRTEKHLQGYYDASAENQYSQSFKANQESYAIMFENGIRSLGYNPHTRFWDNMLRLAFTDPKHFKTHLDLMCQSVHLLNESYQENVSKGTRNLVKVGLGFYLGRKMSQSHRENNQQRDRFAISLISAALRAGAL